MTKSELKEKLKRKLGFPYVKVEITDDQLEDSISDAIDKFCEFAIGNAVSEYYFTLPISAGISEYEMPKGITDIIDYEEGGYVSGINTLFTIENYFYSNGILNPDSFVNGNGLIGYQQALDFLETLARFTVDSYTYRFSRFDKKLSLTPVPDKNTYLLIRSYAYTGSFLNNWNWEDYENKLCNEKWIQEYALALLKINLGYIRRKFSNGSGSIGNVGITLDGSELLSEGKEEKDKLEEELDEKYAFDGYGISMGVM